MEKGDVVYYCDVVPSCNTYEIVELVIRTIGEDWAAGYDAKTKQAHLFKFDMFDKYVFADRYSALEALKEFRGKNDD